MTPYVRILRNIHCDMAWGLPGNRSHLYAEILSNVICKNVEGGLVGKKRIVSDISFTSLSLTIVSAPIISLCLGPSCKVLFSLNTLAWGRPLDRVGFSLNWPILDRVLWYSRLLVGWISLGWVLAGPRFSLFWIFDETSPEQVLVRGEVFSVRIGWFSAFSLCG